jgi:Caspase domain
MRKALVIGINEYPNSPLRGCINDATEFKAIMETNGDGSPNFEIRIEKDVKTRGILLGMIKELFTGDVDISLLYFSGHGYLNDLGGYLVTPDAQKNDEGVSMDEVLQVANTSSIKNKIIILDCCHSGAMGSPKLGGTAAQITTGLTILTASRESEVSMEVNGHGVFTNLLLEALRGGAADLRGHVTPGSVYAYIDQALGAWDHQRPMFKTNITKFTSLRSIPPPVAFDALRKLAEYFPSPTTEFQLDPQYEYTYPKSMPEKVAVFKHLQKFESVGLVVPVGVEHMYWAAMNSKACKLTALGYHYWRLIKDKRI